MTYKPFYINVDWRCVWGGRAFKNHFLWMHMTSAAAIINPFRCNRQHKCTKVVFHVFQLCLMQVTFCIFHSEASNQGTDNLLINCLSLSSRIKCSFVSGNQVGVRTFPAFTVRPPSPLPNGFVLRARNTVLVHCEPHAIMEKIMPVSLLTRHITKLGIETWS